MADNKMHLAMMTVCATSRAVWLKKITIKTQRCQPITPTIFKKSQMVGMIDDTACVRVVDIDFVGVFKNGCGNDLSQWLVST